MTKLEFVESLLGFGPGILAFAVYGWILRRILFRKPDIRTLDVRIRRRLFLAAAFWPFAACLPGVVIFLLLAPGELFPLALALLVSYSIAMLLLLAWYPRLPFLGRFFPERDHCVSLFRRSLPTAVVASFVVWTVVCLAISGGCLGEHFSEGGARSPFRELLYDVPTPQVRHGIHYPRHSFCLLCQLEQDLKHVEMRSQWIPRENSQGGYEMNKTLKDQWTAEGNVVHGGEFEGGK